MVVWVAFGLWLARRRPEVLAFVRAHRRTFLAYEALFAVAFVAWAVYRATVPNIEPAGGEKYMEMAFIDGILASPGFPPNAPLLSGRSLSYYYMGYLRGAQLIPLPGALPYAGFNLMTPMSLHSCRTMRMSLRGSFAFRQAQMKASPLIAGWMSSRV